MAYGSNILKKEAAYYSLVNATIINGILHIGAGGSATQILSVSDLPAVTKNMLFTCISDNEYSNHYVPDIQVIVYTKMNSDVTYSKAILYPVQVAPNKYSCEFTMEEGSYDEMYVTLKAQKSVNLTLWELCAEAADESAIVEIEGVKQSLAKLLYDYNTWPLQVDEYEQTIGVITCRLLDNTDIQGHFSMTGMASESAILTLRFYDNEAEELFAPLEYDIRVGYNSVGVPHSYLDRLAGIHSFTVTAQVTTGTIDIDTRGILFTIDGGYLAAREITVGMDVCDLTIKQTSINSSPEEIWLIGIDEGEAFIRKRSYSDQNTNVGFDPVRSLGKAKDGAIEFDGNWVLRANSQKFTLETEDQPWYFWVDMDNKLIAQDGEDETTRVILDTGVTQVNACKGYSSMFYPEQDQGLVAAYIKSGKPYYIQYIYDVTLGAKRWLQPELLINEHVLDLHVHRLNDYRLGFELTTPIRNLWLYTSRTYVAQAIPKEQGSASLSEKSMFLYAHKDEDLSVAYSQSISEDALTLYINVTKCIRYFYDWRDILSFDEDSIPDSAVDKVEVENGDNSATIIISLKEPPKKLITNVVVNPADSGAVQAEIVGSGYVKAPKKTLVFDTTIYRYLSVQKEQVGIRNVGTGFVYSPIVDRRLAIQIEEAGICNTGAHTQYAMIEDLRNSPQHETGTVRITGALMNYEQVEPSPI
ncbi:MAG: hypothetical protein SOT58_07300 [Agathobacter sp.]|nr:hypothetical protein [Agathobacter sp.]